METPVHRHGATADPRSGSTSRPTAHAPTSRTDPSHPGAPEAKRRGMSTTALALPVAAAALYGLWTVFVDRTSGSSLGHAWLLGLIAAVVSGALGLALVSVQSTLISEVRALAYGALFGTAMGYLYSISHTSGPSILESIRMGLVLGAVMFVVSLYVFRTHRIREPHGQHRPRRARHPHPSH
ncbi:Bax inhibitor-1/YccA family protein [Streptomyces sp. NPDC018045]|uniref:Bax inhibitor-1/YccA family membrane protein n=1 Tax=Streptomyces sp. NPDC018045 TaxID=3365037 RepID=UPI00379084F8